MNQGNNEVTSRAENLKILQCQTRWNCGNDHDPKFIQCVKGNVANRTRRFAPNIWCETNITVQGCKHPNSNVKLLRSLIKSSPTFNTN